MEQILKDALRDVLKISEDSQKEFFERYDEVVNNIQRGIAITDVETDNLSIYPIGEYDYETNIEEVMPFKIVVEYFCNKNAVLKRIEYLKLKAKKKLNTKDKLILDTLAKDTNDVYTNFELAEIIKNILLKSNKEYSVEIRQNSVLLRISRGDDIYDFVIIIAYRFDNDENNINFKYKTAVISLDYDLFFDNFQEKNIRTNGKFKESILLYKFFEMELSFEEMITYRTILEFNLYENLFYNVPDEMFTEDLYDTVLNIANYLHTADLKKFVTIDEKPLIIKNESKEYYNQYIELILKNITTWIELYDKKESD